MSRTEYIIWRAETREQIENEHPDWNAEQVQKYLNVVESILENKGFFGKKDC